MTITKSDGHSHLNCNYIVPHNYLNRKYEIQPAICSKSLINDETSGSNNKSITGSDVPIVDSDFSGHSRNCIINGNADATLTGTVFASYCEIEIDGGGKTASLSAQIIGYTVKITGSQTVNLYYDPDMRAESDPKVGLMYSLYLICGVTV